MWTCVATVFDRRRRIVAVVVSALVIVNDHGFEAIASQNFVKPEPGSGSYRMLRPLRLMTGTTVLITHPSTVIARKIGDNRSANDSVVLGRQSRYSKSQHQSYHSQKRSPVGSTHSSEVLGRRKNETTVLRVPAFAERLANVPLGPEVLAR